MSDNWSHMEVQLSWWPVLTTNQRHCLILDFDRIALHINELVALLAY
jgi:hypothetical protein